jgi:hypothetical protein
VEFWDSRIARLDPIQSNQVNSHLSETAAILNATLQDFRSGTERIDREKTGEEPHDTGLPLMQLRHNTETGLRGDADIYLTDEAPWEDRSDRTTYEETGSRGSAVFFLSQSISGIKAMEASKPSVDQTGKKKTSLYGDKFPRGQSSSGE